MIERLKFINQNIFIYFLVTLFNNFWFITSNWVNYWLKFMSVSEIGIIDALAFGAGVLIEIPSGFISDRLGRKFSLILANFFQFLGSFIITIGIDKFEIGFGFIIFQIGVALFSGSIEAFGYEESIKNNLDYENILLKSQYVGNFGYLLSLFIGGYFYLINKNIPNFLWSINYLISLILCILIIVQTQKYLFDEVETSQKFRLRDYLPVFNFKYTFYLLVLCSLVFSYDFGFIKLMILDTFTNLETNYLVLFFSTLISLSLTTVLIKKFKNYEKIISIIFVLVLLILTFNFYLPYKEIVIFLVFNLLSIYLFQISLSYINSRVRDSVRASFISIFNFLYKIPYILLAIFLAYGLENYSLTDIFTFLGIFLIIMGLIERFFTKIVYNKALVR